MILVFTERSLKYIYSLHQWLTIILHVKFHILPSKLGNKEKQ